ncbi:hypothetical protein KR222_010317 [Zaprionus bogoriensis]|nr:hypothetical protein KR222_010317 [Zaprionus bogoriensis]
MEISIESQGRQWHVLALLLAILVCQYTPSLGQAISTSANLGPFSFKSQCNCSLSMACSCCESAVMDVLNATKALCVTFKVNILKASVDVTVTSDGSTLGTFTLDSKSPLALCMPMVSDMTPLALCIKMSTKLSGLTNLNICPNFYTNFDANQIFSYDLPCVKLGMDGFSIA